MMGKRKQFSNRDERVSNAAKEIDDAMFPSVNDLGLGESEVYEDDVIEQSDDEITRFEEITGGSIQIGKAKVTAIGLVLDAQLNIDEFNSLGEALLEFQSGFAWCVGDWLNYGDNFEWGSTYPRLAEMFELDESTLRNYKLTASKVDLSIRNRQLSFSHHRLVAHMKPVHQRQWLKSAEKEKWSVSKLRHNIREAENSKRRAKQKQTRNQYMEVRNINKQEIRQFQLAIRRGDFDEAEHSIEKLQYVVDTLKSIYEAEKELINIVDA